MGPAIFAQFIILCIGDIRVAKIIAGCESLMQWLEASSQDGDQRVNELSKAVGRILLKKAGSGCENEARIMRALCGKAIADFVPLIEMR